MAAPPRINVRGIRQSVPAGYLVGRVPNGAPGPAQLLTGADLAQILRQAGPGGGLGPVPAILPTIGSGHVLGNAAPGSATATDTSLTALFDRAFTTTQGSLLYRNGTVWTWLGPGTSGQVLKTQGAGANPTWLTLAAIATSGSASDLITGTVPSARVSGSYTGITGVGTLTVGTWQATKIGLAYGGTNADLSATGGTSQVLRQSSAGAAITVSQLAASDLSNGTTGTGAVVLATSPTLVTPLLGTPTSGNLANCTGYPVSSLSGLGTGVAAALAVNVGTAGAFVVNGGALGTPSSGTLTNATGLPIVGGTTGTLTVARGGTNSTSYTAGSVIFAGTSGTSLTEDNSNFFWNNSSKALGLGTTNPRQRLEIANTGSPAIAFFETGGGTNAKNGDILFGSNTFQARWVNDAYNAATVFLYATRSGTTSLTVEPSAETHKWYNSARTINYGNFGNDGSGNLFMYLGGSSYSTQNISLQVGEGRTGSGFAYVDLVGDTTYTDFGFRMIRSNGGANTTSEINHRGTGPFQLTTTEAGPIDIYTASTFRARFDSSGNLGLGTSTPIRQLTLTSELSLTSSGGDLYINGSDGAGSNGGSRNITIRGLASSGASEVSLANIFLTTAAIVVPNQSIYYAKDTGGTARAVLYGRWSDNATYIDGGSATYLRTNNGSVLNAFLYTNGGIMLNGGASTPRATLDMNNSMICGVSNISGDSSSSAYTIWAGGPSGIDGGYIQLWGSASGSPRNCFIGNDSSGAIISVLATGSNVGIGTATVRTGTKLRVLGGDDDALFFVTGASFSARIGSNGFNSRIEGVDTTAVGSYQQFCVGGSSVIILNSGTTMWSAASSLIKHFAPCIPGSDNTYGCGNSTFRWTDVWAVNGTIQTSDAREKVDVKDSGLGLDFICKLKPRSWRWKNGHYDTTPRKKLHPEDALEPDYDLVPVAGKRRHHGLLAQEVKEALGDTDFGGWILTDPNDPNSPQALRMDQFIAPLVAAIQELRAMVDKLSKK